jgi:hypothetical protein
MALQTLRYFSRARVIPTFGSPGTLDSVWRDVGKPCDLRPPKIEVYGASGRILVVDGAEEIIGGPPPDTYCRICGDCL